MTADTAWFRKYWVPHRGRFRYVPVAWQGWVALLAAVAAPQLVWLIPARLWPHPLLRLPGSSIILLIALMLLFRLVRLRSARMDAG